MIEFNHVALHYHYDEFTVLKDLNFTLIDGVNTVLCDSQSGKTSICKLLTKQFSPTSGQIIVDGADIASITNQGLGILYMPAIPAFFENRTVKYNVLYPLKVRKIRKDEQLARFSEIADLTGLNNVGAKVKKLSLSERKRIAIARGLTVRRRAVLLDDFCENTEQLDELIGLFDGSVIVNFTSDISLARGNVIVLDGGVSIYQGDVDGAQKIRKELNWIMDLLRSE